MEYDNVQNKGKTGTMEGLKQAVRDPVVWLFAAMAHMHLAANGFKNFVSHDFYTYTEAQPIDQFI